ncbi:ATP-binding cassette domain-containing protein [Paenibacillus sp. GCM10027628]|uniref:ABC transporter ATP-binding protein n=1 Tax=Paenibacillus sp. GCM10027628 TaxID=3273413 RepID=UPI003628E41C
MTAIEVHGLTKSFQIKQKQEGFRGSLRSLFSPTYTTKEAVKPIEFSAEQGEVLAFLGPNGAGKSTTIKMLTGILHPTSGSAKVLGFNPWKERQQLAFRIGSVFGQKSQLWYHLPPTDTFELMSRIYELKRSDYLQRREELIRRFELQPYLNTPVRKLSLGERMRCEIACSLLHRPGLLFLDEPTIGLDVVVKQTIRELIRDMNREEGTTIFLTSHDAGDIEQLCRRAIVINHGEIILDDEVTRMKKDFLTAKTIRLQLAEEVHEIPQIPHADVQYTGGQQMTVVIDTSKAAIEEVLSKLMEGVRILDLTVEDPPMEQIITHIYSQQRKEAHLP